MRGTNKVLAANQRQKIIDVASRLMSEKGYKAATFQEIADKVGIHKSTIFHYFKNKEELLLAILRSSIEGSTERLTRLVEDTSLSPEEKLRAAIRTHLDLLVKYKDNVNVYNSELRFLSVEKRHGYLRKRKLYGHCIEHIVDELKKQNAGYFKGLDTKIVAFAILGMCNWVGRWYRENGRYTLKEIAEMFYRLIMPY